MKNSVIYVLVAGLLVLGGVYISDNMTKSAQLKELEQLQQDNGLCDGSGGCQVSNESKVGFEVGNYFPNVKIEHKPPKVSDIVNSTCSTEKLHKFFPDAKERLFDECFKETLFWIKENSENQST